jgi:hypothetical protein
VGDHDAEDRVGVIRQRRADGLARPTVPDAQALLEPAADEARAVPRERQGAQIQEGARDADRASDGDVPEV